MHTGKFETQKRLTAANLRERAVYGNLLSIGEGLLCQRDSLLSHRDDGRFLKRRHLPRQAFSYIKMLTETPTETEEEKAQREAKELEEMLKLYE